MVRTRSHPNPFAFVFAQVRTSHVRVMRSAPTLLYRASTQQVCSALHVPSVRTARDHHHRLYYHVRTADVLVLLVIARVRVCLPAACFRAHPCVCVCVMCTMRLRCCRRGADAAAPRCRRHRPHVHAHLMQLPSRC